MIQQSPRKTPLLALVDCEIKLPRSANQIIYGQQHEVLTILEKHFDNLNNVELYCPARNSTMGLLNFEQTRAQIEYGAIVRDHVTIEDSAVIMMGAILNCGCRIGANTRVDFGVIIGAGAKLGKCCHIGANSVIGTAELPMNEKSVIIENNVFVGPGVVVLDGVHIAEGAEIAAGSVVVDDVPVNAVMAGCPAKIIKIKDKKTESGTQWLEALREL